MKFLLAVLGIRFLVEMLGNNSNSNYRPEDESDIKPGRIFHPAEFALR